MYRREAGEPQLTFNYIKAMSDFGHAWLVPEHDHSGERAALKL